MGNPFDNFGEVASGTKRSIADDLALQGYTLVCSFCDSQLVIAQSLGSRVPAWEARVVGVSSSRQQSFKDLP
jgi:hypothetical protein